jgi:RNA polymerase primary sigma factor
MAGFVCEPLAELTRQLVYAPAGRRRMQMDRAEALYDQIHPDHRYPLEWVTRQITGYAPDTSDESVTLVGLAVRQDLVRMVDVLGDSLDETPADYDEPPLSLNDLGERWQVSGKTIGRYRRQGLFARKLRLDDNRRHIMFLPSSVERFEATHPGRIKQATQFSRIDDATHHAILTRARRIAGRVTVSPFVVARHLAPKYGRSVETVRRMLVEHDKRHPRFAIFRDHTPPLTLKQQRVIHRAYHRGVSVTKLAERFGKARDAIYRAINHRRAAALAELDLRCIEMPTFDRSDAEEVICAGDVNDMIAAAARSPDKDKPSDTAETQALLEGLPAYVRDIYDVPLLGAEAEQALFVRYNFLKYRARQLRAQLDRYRPSAGTLDRIETYLRRAVTIKQHLVRANLRLVVAAARRHATARSHKQQSLVDLVGEGNLVLLEAIETFDAARGNRFSTYLTWALMRHFATAKRKQAAALSDDQVQRLEYWPAAMNPALAAAEQAEYTQHTLEQLLGELDDRERLVITRHFGLGQREQPHTLAEVGQEMGISAERARQIERTAMTKLRRAAARLDLGSL